MHSRLLAVLPYLLYGQALLCCPDSPAYLHSRCPVPATHRPALTCQLSFLLLCFLLAVMSHLLTAQLLFSLCCSQASLSSWIFCLFCFLCCLFALSFLTSSLFTISCFVIHPLLLAMLPPLLVVHPLLLAIFPSPLLTAEGLSRLCYSPSSLYACCLTLLLYLFTAHFSVCPVRICLSTTRQICVCYSTLQKIPIFP